MFGLGKKPTPSLTREQSLSACMARTRTVRAEPGDEGGITLHVPFRASALVMRLSRWLGGGAGEARVELDEIGAFVWEMCDGDTSVREMIARLSERHQIGRKEAEVSLMTFLKTLMRRGLVSAIVEKEKPPPSENKT